MRLPITSGAREIKYNGVAFSTTALQEGQYTFWGYEHLMYKPTLVGDGKTVADILANQIITADASILLSTMRCNRQTDGGQVAPTY